MSNSKPIIFSGAMICAIIEGRKTVTRRMIRPQPDSGHIIAEINESPGFWLGIPVLGGMTPVQRLKCPYEIGMELWVRESFSLDQCFDEGTLSPDHGSTIPKGAFVEGCKAIGKQVPTIQYTADGAFNHTPPEFWKPGKLHPSIHMPHWASRITLRLTDVKAERLQDISEADAKAEGAEPAAIADLGNTWHSYRAGFQALWDSINFKRGLGWDSNPLVWVLAFDIANVGYIRHHR